MKFLVLLPLFLAACTIIPGPHGKAIFGGDYTKLSYSDGPVRFTADRAMHSTAARVHWHGVSNLASEAVTGAIGLKGGNEVVGGVASVVTPIVNRPTSRSIQTP